jgi:hypothetical protein
MLREAAGRYVALDGRMWRTLIGLFFRPGFLSREYFAGRRRRYIRPARLFLVRSYPLRPRRYAAHLVFGAYNHAFLFLVGLLLVLPIAPLRAALLI